MTTALTIDWSTYELQENLPLYLDLFIDRSREDGDLWWHTRSCHEARRRGADDANWVVRVPTDVMRAAFAGMQAEPVVAKRVGFCRGCIVRPAVSA